MSIARRHILYDSCYAHLTMRCLNREYFFKSPAIKNYILEVWAKYKDRYKIKIFDYTIMDNHCHLLVHLESVEKLGHFMRIANSLIAKRFNTEVGRDSHALKERYKSPLIACDSYLENTIAYIWFNFHRISKATKPQDYRYTSLYYRYRGLPHSILSSYDELPLPMGQSDIKFVHDLVNAKLGTELSPQIFEHSHTLGSLSQVGQRSSEIKHLRQDSS